MPGPAPKLIRRRRNVPASGEWRRATVDRWQHGPVPDPPDGLTNESKEAWALWFSSWVAAYWSPIDIPGLRVAIRSLDQVQRAMRSGNASGRQIRESQAWLNAYGLTPKGRQLRHWLPPLAVDDARTSDL
jgi:hypothetical protein